MAFKQGLYTSCGCDAQYFSNSFSTEPLPIAWLASRFVIRHVYPTTCALRHPAQFAILGLVVRLTSAHAYYTYVQLHYVSDVINSVPIKLFTVSQVKTTGCQRLNHAHAQFCKQSNQTRWNSYITFQFYVNNIQLISTDDASLYLNATYTTSCLIIQSPTLHCNCRCGFVVCLGVLSENEAKTKESFGVFCRTSRGICSTVAARTRLYGSARLWGIHYRVCILCAGTTR